MNCKLVLLDLKTVGAKRSKSNGPQMNYVKLKSREQKLNQEVNEQYINKTLSEHFFPHVLNDEINKSGGKKKKQFSFNMISSR